MLVCIKDAKWEHETGLACFYHRPEVKVTRHPRAARTERRSRIYVVDRHALMRKAAAEWIAGCSDLEVCGTSGSMASTFKAIRRLHPDLVVCEILRPQDLGFIRELHWRHRDLPILVFTSQDAAVYAARAREAGAWAYVMKEAGGDAFLQNIHAVLCRRNSVRNAVAAKRQGIGRGMGT